MIESDKPTLILDQYFRTIEELFSDKSYSELHSLCNVIGGGNMPMSRGVILANLPTASFYIAAQPTLSKEELLSAKKLQAIIEVSGTFWTGLDYSTCFEREIEVMSCAPGFQFSVAEMTLGLMLCGARGIVNEHERFRDGLENWLDDNSATDFTLYEQDIGFIGYGSIARETVRLLAPFRPRIKVFDPWLAASTPDLPNVTFCELDELVTQSRCIVVAAIPTDENYKLLNKTLIEQMQSGTLVVLISRSHLVDFDALIRASNQGHIRVATDVFPIEPVVLNAPIRQSTNIILSPHRAAAVSKGRHPIGEMIVHDIRNILNNETARKLQRATPEHVDHITRAPSVAQAKEL